MCVNCQCCGCYVWNNSSVPSEAWPPPAPSAMLECSASPQPPAEAPPPPAAPVCPYCRREYACCPPPTPAALLEPGCRPAPAPFCAARRRHHVLSGGGLIEVPPPRGFFDFDDAPALDGDADSDAEEYIDFEEYESAFEVDYETPMMDFAPPTFDFSRPTGEPMTPTFDFAAPVAVSGGGAITPPMFVQPVEEEEPPLPLPRPPPVRFDEVSSVEICPLTALQLFNETVNKLRHSGWFHDLRSESSNEELKGLPLGTFFVRPSADVGHLFALSVQTEKGPTSVRFTQVNGHFRLEAMPELRGNMPLFRRLPDLIQFYVLRYQVIKEYQANLSSDDPIHKKLHDLLEHRQGAWVDENGKFYGYIRIERPYYRGEPPSLRHFARLAVNRAMTDRMRPRPVAAARHRRLPLPRALADYLQEYPYCI